MTNYEKKKASIRKTHALDDLHSEIAALKEQLATERMSADKTLEHNNRLINEVDELKEQLEQSADISNREMVYLDGTGWGINALRNAIMRADDCECEVLKKQLAESDKKLVVANNASWMSRVHMLCTDIGIEPGHIDYRTEQLVTKVHDLQEQLTDSENRVRYWQVHSETDQETIGRLEARMKSASAIRIGNAKRQGDRIKDLVKQVNLLCGENRYKDADICQKNEQIEILEARVRELKKHRGLDKKIMDGLQDRIGTAYDTGRKEAARECIEIIDDTWCGEDYCCLCSDISVTAIKCKFNLTGGGE